MTSLVCLDPGHGQIDPGAIGRHGDRVVREADATWAVCIGVRLLLEQKAVGVITTRSQGRAGRKLTLRNRVVKSNVGGADLFVSVHYNAHSNPEAHGVEVLHWHSSSAGRSLAGSILSRLERMPQALRRRSRGLKPKKTGDRGAHLLQKTKAPAVIVELPFLTNSADFVVGSRADFQVEAAVAIAGGILSRLLV